MPTTEQRRAHYDTFVTRVVDLCAIKPIRNDLRSGRGRPVEECDRMQPHLIRHIAGHGARRAHYTTASLIALHRDLETPYTPRRPAQHTATPPGPGDGPTAPQAAPDGQDRPTPAVGTEGQDHPNQTGPESTATPISPEHAAARQWRTRPNLGTSLALAVHRHGFDAPRMTDRLRLLTRLSTSQLHPRLWSLTTHLNARDAARLDFAVLLEDLTWWDDDRPQITTRWRESYFLTLHAHTPDEDH
ncbi:type I-E CRISPR-associated protein Cse2/CasB [Streptomyces sp. NPDC057021]|uniref:type I-E CRISPR-associated protein Cse2/CasB n=1 Tax=Streptomyces sp. NPDC057021 TaxID=3346003 RepID=UPI0036274F31